MQTLRGTVERITFQNEETGFTVFRFRPDDSLQDVVCVGTAPTIEAGLTLQIGGTLESHKKYGRQFSVERYEIVRPTTVEGISRLLSSGFIQNIGNVRAKRVIDAFGVRTLDILDNEPQRLAEVNGIGPRILAGIRQAWDRQKHLRSLLLFLQGFGVTLSLAYKIHKAYGDQAQARVSADPYALIDDIWGVGFKRADAIAQKLGFTHDSNKRIRAGLAHLLHEAAADGHCYLPQAELAERAATLLQVEEPHVVMSLDHAVEAHLLVREDQRIWLPLYYHAERRCAEVLTGVLAAGRGAVDGDETARRRWLEEQARASGWQVDPTQITACAAALRSPLFVLTGGPGTGKTTALHLIVSYLRHRGLRVALAAPTGRAAQRLGSVAGLQAQTIHRLLEFRPAGSGERFGRNAQRPLQADVIIVDEVSMVDVLLLRALLEALPQRCPVIFVGDANQLPSVGAGNVLADMTASGAVAHVELSTLFRQAAASRIVTVAHEMMHGEVSGFANGPDDNCFFLTADEPQRCQQTVVELVCDRLPKRYGLDARTDIQVLAPMHRGEVGTQELNRILQGRLTSGGASLSRGEVSFTVGDRVMQLRNNYDLGVFNGDIGYVAELTDGSGLAVDFGAVTASYEPKDLDELTHAYCISIHKSQGCEFPAVVIPLLTQHFVMLKRNLVYTALTRGRKLCVFVGSPRAFALAVRNAESLRRYSRLAERLREQGTNGSSHGQT